MLAGKALLDHANLFSPNDYKTNDKITYKYFKDKYDRSLELRLKKVDETRNYLLEEVNHIDLMSEKYNKTCKYLSCVEHLLILASAVTGCV